ncbi:MFS transporter [Nocardia sp. NPDC049190]|uniref:MFS transporter n=1 Tax=Nocardia sp. NPDC049190 TaxID=3155650 RepID=UPI003403CF56
MDTATTESATLADGARRRWTTAVAALSCFLMTLDVTVVNVALPEIQSDLDASLDSLQWTVNAYVLAFAALLLTVGSLSDRYSRRSLFLAGLAVFSVASALCMTARSDTALIAARAVQGVGGALVFGTCLALVADAYIGAAEEMRRKAVGAAIAAGAAAAALGPLIGGGLVQAGSWQWIFAVNIPIGVVLIVATVLRVPTVERAPAIDGAVDRVGAVLVVVPLFTANYGLLTGADSGWGQPKVIAALTIAVATGSGFVWLELRRGGTALLDLGLFRIPTFAAAIVLGFVVRLLTFGIFPFLILWLAGAHEMSAFRTGLVLTALAVPLMIAAGVGTPLARVIGVARTMTLAMIITAAGLFLGTLIDGTGPWQAALPCLVAVGIGCGLAMPHLMNLAVDVAPPDKAGMATGAANTALPLGTAAGVALFGVVLSSRVRAEIDAEAVGAGAERFAAAVIAGILRYPSAAQTELAISAFTHGLRLIFVLAGCGALAAAIISALLLRNVDRRDSTPATGQTPTDTRGNP